MVDVQFKDKIKYVTDSLKYTFKILNLFLLSDGIKSKREDKIKESEILKIIDEIYNKNLKESLKEINSFFGGIIQDFDNIFSENKTPAEIKKKYYAFKEKFKTEKDNLEIKIYEKLDDYQIKLKEIVDKNRKELLFTSEDKEKSFSLSDLIEIGFCIILSVPFGAICLASLPFFGIGLLVNKIFKRDALTQKKIENFKYSLYDSWKFSIYNIMLRYENIKEKSINEIKKIYKSSNINIEPIKQKKEKYNKIYEKFQKLIEQ